MLGVYQKDISRWETGEVSPSIETLKEICIQLKTSADELLELK
ncbi:helix-turn-helix domain-containing protein [Lactonifactor sp. BIOML-A1]|nr:helix-turn-helix domain-containing protein [Lactonifactor sp. BIOML-A1]